MGTSWSHINVIYSPHLFQLLLPRKFSILRKKKEKNIKKQARLLGAAFGKLSLANKNETDLPVLPHPISLPGEMPYITEWQDSNRITVELRSYCNQFESYMNV